MVETWDMERRQAAGQKVKDEADKTARRLGAKACVVIAFFPDKDGEELHIIDGGKAPMTLPALYLKMLTMYQILDETGGEDVHLQ